MKMVAGSILVLAAAVFVPGGLLADALYRMDTRGRPGGVDGTLLALLLLLAAAVAGLGAALVVNGLVAAEAGRRREGELPRVPEDRITSTGMP